MPEIERCDKCNNITQIKSSTNYRHPMMIASYLLATVIVLQFLDVLALIIDCIGRST